MLLFFCFVFVGDLYGAIGSPVRLSKTVVVGRRQEFVQRLLYVLTYFIRCSELLETHMLDSAEDEAIVMPGSLITTSLRKGEVEESDYVLVTVHKPSGDYLSQGAHSQQTEAEDSIYPSDNSLQSSTYTDNEVEHSTEGPPNEEEEDDEDEEDSSESQGSRSSVLQAGHSQGTIPGNRTAEVAEPGNVCKQSSSPLVTEARVETALHVGFASVRAPGCVSNAETKGNLKPIDPSIPTSYASAPSPLVATESKNCGIDDAINAASGNQTTKVLAPRPLGMPLEKKPPDRSLVIPVPVTGPMAMTLPEAEEPATKVTFLIGDSMSPESDTESRGRKVEEDFRKHKKHMQQLHQPSQHQQGQHYQQQQQPLQRDLKTSSSRVTEDQTRRTKAASVRQKEPSKISQWDPNCGDEFNEYFSLENPVETRTIDDVAKHKASMGPLVVPQHHELVDHGFESKARVRGLGLCLAPASGEMLSCRKGETLLDLERRCRCGSTDSSDICSCKGCPAEQDGHLVLSVPVPQDGRSNGKEDQKQKAPLVNEWEIPRNESSDSALGDSESEETEDWQEEVLVPFPG